MNEAKEMHRDLMNALLPILPRKVYGDFRRVVNLVWAIVVAFLGTALEPVHRALACPQDQSDDP